jgi:2-methylcitrate dehydratase PrpD
MNRFCKEAVENSDIQELSSRIKASSGEKWEKHFPHIRGASLQITTKGGEQYSMDVDLPKGEPENPATHDDLINKFKSNAAGMDKENCDALISTILNLENHSVEDLATYFTADCFK